MTDNGAIQTGKAHPHRDTISHPYAPIPAASNVEKDAIEDLHRKSASPEESPLLHQTNIEYAEPLIKKPQYDPAPQEGWISMQQHSIGIIRRLVMEFLDRWEKLLKLWDLCTFSRENGVA